MVGLDRDQREELIDGHSTRGDIGLQTRNVSMPDVESRLADLELKVQELTENQEAIIADAAMVPDSLALNMRILTRHIDTKFAAQDRKIDARFAEQDRRIDSKFAAQDRKIDQLQSDVSHLKTDVSHLKTDVSHLTTDVAAILKILGEQFKPKT
jgi:uncharacterized coiled-coil protein SlyX